MQDIQTCCTIAQEQLLGLWLHPYTFQNMARMAKGMDIWYSCMVYLFH